LEILEMALKKKQRIAACKGQLCNEKERKKDSSAASSRK